MGKIALCFSGQGAQYPGMGKDFYEDYSLVRNLYESAGNIFPDIKRISFESTKQELGITTNTQPCMFVFETAVAGLLEENGVSPDLIAGFSMGEVSALSFAGAMDFSAGLEYTIQRATAMNECAVRNPGRMAAIIKVSSDEVDEICKKYEGVWAVNYNSDLQTVVSGKESSVLAVAKDCKAAGGRAIILDVSGAFHSPYMKEASEVAENYLKNVKINKLKYTLYSNVTGDIMDDSEIKKYMSRQISSPVLWKQSITRMIKDGADTFIETGPGNVLSGLIKKINPDVKVYSISDVLSFSETINKIKV